MKIAILSRNKNLHSIRRLMEEARKNKIIIDVIDPLECQLSIGDKSSQIIYQGKPLPWYDIILPRIGASITDYGLAVVRQFEALGMHSINPSFAIADSRDKMRCLQVLTQNKIQVPPSVLCRSQKSLRAAVGAVKGMPVVLKVLKGTQGVGVMIVHSLISMSSVMDTLHSMEQDVLIQQFIAEGAGRDYRAFVIGNKVVAAMLRTAPEGEFRSNIHRGGIGRPLKLPVSYERAAIRAAQVLGLKVAGVDIMQSEKGPVIIEVNSSPGYEGIEKATGANIAKFILNCLVNEAKAHKKRKKRRKPSRPRTLKRRS